MVPHWSLRPSWLFCYYFFSSCISECIVLPCPWILWSFVCLTEFAVDSYIILQFGYCILQLYDFCLEFKNIFYLPFEILICSRIAFLALPNILRAIILNSLWDKSVISISLRSVLGVSSCSFGTSSFGAYSSLSSFSLMLY